MENLTKFTGHKKQLKKHRFYSIILVKQANKEKEIGLESLHNCLKYENRQSTKTIQSNHICEEGTFKKNFELWSPKDTPHSQII